MSLSLDLSRRCVSEACEDAGVTLVTPESLSIIRLATYLAIVAVTPLTLSEARQRVSVYVPELVADIADLLPSPASELLDLERSVIVVGERMWEDAELLAGGVAHELAHHRRDLAVRRSAGVIGSILWGTAYLAHPMIRAWEEGTCYQCDIAAAVILRGIDPDEAGDEADRSLASIYDLDAPSKALGHDAVRSAVESLRAGELPGMGTTMHAMLRRLVFAGWDPGPWAGAIIGTAVPT